MNWENIDLNSSYEKSQSVLDSYDIDTLLLEIECNFKKEDITKETVLKHVKNVIGDRVAQAMEIFEQNITNIVNKAKEQRD